MKAEKKAKASDPGLLFQFEMEKRLECTQCHRVKYSTFKDNMLQLNPPVSSDVEKGTEVDFNACLEAYFGDCLLDDVECS